MDQRSSTLLAWSFLGITLPTASIDLTVRGPSLHGQIPVEAGHT